MSERYFVTFGQQYEEVRDGWVEFNADSRQCATDAAWILFGNRWSMLYDESEFKPEYFPKGRLGPVRNATLAATFLRAKLKEAREQAGEGAK